MTNSSGSFTISWTDPSASGNVAANFIWVGEHKDGRFAVRTSSGGQRIFWTTSFTLSNAVNTDIATWDLGQRKRTELARECLRRRISHVAFGLSQSNRMNAFFIGHRTKVVANRP